MTDVVLTVKAEIDADPLTRGYAAMTDLQVADDMNIAYRTQNRDSMSGDEAFQATSPAEFDALATGSGNTPDEQGHWLAFCGRENIDPFATANVQFVSTLFGAGSVTLAALQSARVESITRAQELGISLVREGDVTAARSLP